MTPRTTYSYQVLSIASLRTRKSSFEAAVKIVTNKTTASGFNLDTSEIETNLSSRIDGTRSEQLPIAASIPMTNHHCIG